MTKWDTTTIRQVCSTYSGGTPSTAHPEYYSGDIPWIVSADLNQGRIKSVKGRISRRGLDRSSAKLVKPGTPLIALYGATAGVAAIAHISGAINQAVLAMIPRDIEAEYLYQWLQANRDAVIDQYTQGGQPNLSGAIVRGIQIPLPSVAEQGRIVEALGDADDLIAALERLIAKKQAIKQGMMQQLLTGESRPPGFTKSWREYTIGDLTTIVKGRQLGRSEMDSNQSVPVWNGGVEPSGFTNTSSHDRPVVTVSEGGNSCGWVGKPDGPFWLGGHCYALDPEDSGYSVAFVYYALKYRESDIMALRVGSGLPNVQVKRLADFALIVPKDRAEADAIATVLDDAEREMDLLRQRLAKALGVKRGMMQELLTGRTRLPVTEIAA